MDHVDHHLREAAPALLFMCMTVLCPRLLVAIVARTFRAIFSQVLIEMGSCWAAGFYAVINSASDYLEDVEETMVNATKSAMPQLLGATLLCLLGLPTGCAAAQMPALPP